MRTGDRVLLAADPSRRVLRVFPPATLDALLPALDDDSHLTDSDGPKGVTAHWIRHTTLKWVERTHGYAVARAYAGHTEQGGSDVGTTITYVKGELGEVAAALADLTGEPHPLANPDAATDAAA